MTARDYSRAARAGCVWYFAYGSNLDPETFEGRRRMRPTASVLGRAPGRRLVFDLPVGRGERGVANLATAPDSFTWGVCYEITLDQAEWLDRTEGVPAGAYERISLDVVSPDESVRRAFTYASRRGARGRKPSPRYMAIILAGARHHALPDDWIAWLEAHPLAIDERSPEARATAPKR